MQSPEEYSDKKDSSIWSFNLFLSDLSKIIYFRYIFCVFIFHLSLFHPEHTLSDEITVYGFQNIPLMNKLAQVDEKCFLFDTPYGRIIHAFAKGKIKENEVTNFYSETLRELGWKELDRLKFFRDGEYLRVEIEDLKDGELGVYFSVRPSQNLDKIKQ